MSRIFLISVCLTCIVGCSSEPDVGTVGFELSESNADVTVVVDGTPIDLTVQRRPLEYSVGDHGLVVSGSGYERIETSFQVTAGENPVYKIDLVRLEQEVDAGSDSLPKGESVARVGGDAPDDTDVADAGGGPRSNASPSDANDSASASEVVTVEENSESTNEDVGLTSREQEFVAWVTSKGGVLIRETPLHVKFGRHVKLSEQEFSRFIDLPHLENLEFRFSFNQDASGHYVSDRSLLALANLPSLQTITASGISDRALEHLARFPISSLHIPESEVTNEGIGDFSRHALRYLSISSNPQIDEGLMRLSIANLQLLYADNTGITDRFIGRLEEAQHLRYLSIGSTNINPDSLAVLHDKRLLQLIAYDLKIRDEHLRYLENSSDLWQLNIEGSNVTQAGVRFVVRTFPKLNDLSIRRLRLPENAIVDWSNQQSLGILHFQENHVGNGQLQSFAVMKKLIDLRISTDAPYFKATAKGLLAFKNELPNCKINGKTVDELILLLSQ